MQDPNPLPWGAQDRFQAHFIVRVDPFLWDVKNFVKVEWDGPGKLSIKLNEDVELNEMIAKQSIKNATIYVEPTDSAVRIRSKWDNHIAFSISKELFEIYDKIAGHIKSI